MEHIHSVPTVSSHYTRAKSPDICYLEGNLNIKKLFRLHQIWMEEKYPDETRVRLSFYRNQFRGLRLGFQPPMTDMCSCCDHLKVALAKATPEVAVGLQAMFNEHLNQAKEGQRLMKSFVSNEDNDAKCICLDLQQTLPVPRLSTSVAYYQKKLWMYNLCIHDLRDWWSFSEVVFVGQCEALVCLGFA